VERRRQRQMCIRDRTGAAIRGITTPRVRTWLSLAGGAMITALAIVLAARAFG
jgi:hypothetical protein